MPVRFSPSPWSGRILATLALLVALCAHYSPAHANVPLIRDEEIESTLRQWSTPVLKAANLDPQRVRIHLVPSDELNAFVAYGQNIFIYTGLLQQARNPEEIIGVIAHEAAHIANGHLARFDLLKKNAAKQQILSMLLGAGAAMAGAAGGSSDDAIQGGYATLLGGKHIAERRLLSEIRSFEASADEAALRYLDDVGVTSRGFMTFLQTLERRSKLYAGNVDPYILTHPLSKARIRRVRAHVEKSTHAKPAPAPAAERFARMQAKLRGFLSPSQRTLGLYRDDNTVAGRYARAIAWYRSNQLDKALKETRALIALEPKNPYFHELLGQIFFEHGRIREAIPPLQESLKLAPHSALMRINLARAQIESDDPENAARAVEHLRSALRIDASNAFAWHFLALAYGKKGEVGHAALAVAEQALLNGNQKRAHTQAQRALKLLPKGSSQRRRALDIVALTAKA